MLYVLPPPDRSVTTYRCTLITKVIHLGWLLCAKRKVEVAQPVYNAMHLASYVIMFRCDTSLEQLNRPSRLGSPFELRATTGPSTLVPTSHTDTWPLSLHSPLQPRIQSNYIILHVYSLPIFHHWRNRIRTYHIRNHLEPLLKGLYLDLIARGIVESHCRVVNLLLGMLLFRVLELIRLIREMGGLRRR